MCVMLSIKLNFDAKESKLRSKKIHDILIQSDQGWGLSSTFHDDSSGLVALHLRGVRHFLSSVMQVICFRQDSNFLSFVFILSGM